MTNRGDDSGFDAELERDLRAAWREVDALVPNDEVSDARTLAVVSTLRSAWRALPVPAPRRRHRPLPLMRVATLAAGLAIVTFGLTRVRVDAPPSPPPSITSTSAPDWRLMADLTLATLGHGPSAAFLPIVCLCCDALLVADLERSLLRPALGETDQTIATAIAADCRGDWSETVGLLEPVLRESTLTASQRVRAAAALSHAYRQLGRSDDAARAEREFVAAR